MQLQKWLGVLWSNRGRVAVATILHISSWIIGTLEVWIALRLTDHAVGPQQAVILASLAYAVRSVWFAVPGGVGVQEGGFVLIGQLLGIAAETAIALSLVLRVPDVVLGLPGLAAWHWLEARRAFGTDQTSGEGPRGQTLMNPVTIGTAI